MSESLTLSLFETDLGYAGHGCTKKTCLQGEQTLITCSLDQSVGTVFLECDTVGARALIDALQRLIAEGGTPHTHIDLDEDRRFGIRAKELIIDYLEGDWSDEIGGPESPAP
ncbi:hypothetical protein [Devosia sp.]|uniref:hypothetical protein n=1 Tax=Devosia sp. TaxID=1871048 RepID=UPI0019D8CCDF|nr:hypothetical protein [Devosia sp.]MBE0578233.1 hypothetical protein [Devosia sp.]